MVHQIKKMVFLCLSLGYRLFTHLVQVDDQCIVFMAFHGRGYLDNPKALYEELMKEKKMKIIWIINDQDSSLPVKQYRYLSLCYFLAFIKAKYWIVNCKLPDYLYKNKNQIYLQTWHGTPLKRLGHDIVEVEGQSYYRDGSSRQDMLASYDKDAKKYDYMLSPNRFCDEVFKSAFHVHEKQLLKIGYPRNDVLSHVNVEQIRSIKESMNLPLDKKIILYAPTMRDDQLDLKGYHLHLEVDFLKWKKYLSKDYIVLFKPHYLIVDHTLSQKGIEDFVYFVSPHQEISQLYLISDLLITDYSSVFFDYALLKRPIYFYMYDKKAYESILRGFYLNVEEDLPGPIYEQEDDLLKAIGENQVWSEKLETFNQRFNHRQDGHCAKSVLNVLFMKE